MREGRVNLRAMFCGLVAIALCAACPVPAGAQWSGREGSTTSGPSLDDYVKDVGADAKVIPQGQLKIDGMSVTCGKRPTVMNPNFDSWGGAFPGFMILNNKKIMGLSTQTKLYIYSHECGHQFEGADETKAD